MARNLAATFVVLFGFVAGAFAADDSRRTYANPVDVDYRYNFEQINEQISYRTGADPVIVRHKDAYYLFMTLADGYWRSTNLLDWSFITPSRWPFASVVAPAAISDGDRLLLMPSITRPDPILVSRDPAHGQLDFLTRRMPELPGACVRESARSGCAGIREIRNPSVFRRGPGIPRCSRTTTAAGISTGDPPTRSRCTASRSTCARPMRSSAFTTSASPAP